MSTRTEHIARLTEMSVRAQAIADELASQDDAPITISNSEVTENPPDLTDWDAKRAETAERERQKSVLGVERALAAWEKYDIALPPARNVQLLVEERDDAVGRLGAARDERDKATEAMRIAQRLADSGTKALADLKADRDSWRNRADQNMGEAIEADAALADLKARLPGLVVPPENWREQVFDATDNAEVEDKWQAVTRLIESWRAEPASREPGTPGQEFHDGDRVAWHHGKGVENGTVDIACHAGKTLLRLDNGKRVWVHPEAVTPIGEREGDR